MCSEAQEQLRAQGVVNPAGYLGYYLPELVDER
jgi:hypothetical protein